MNDRDGQFADAARVVDDSLVMRIIAGSAAAIEGAIAGSKVAELLKRAHITNVGVVITTACVTHAALLQLMPDRIAPVKPLAYGMVVAFGALAAVAGFITTRSDATAIAESIAGTAKTRKS